jgi:hypothetical protein
MRRIVSASILILLSTCIAAMAAADNPYIIRQGGIQAGQGGRDHWFRLNKYTGELWICFNPISNPTKSCFVALKAIAPSNSDEPRFEMTRNHGIGGVIGVGAVITDMKAAQAWMCGDGCAPVVLKLAGQ